MPLPLSNDIDLFDYTFLHELNITRLVVEKYEVDSSNAIISVYPATEPRSVPGVGTSKDKANFTSAGLGILCVPWAPSFLRNPAFPFSCCTEAVFF